MALGVPSQKTREGRNREKNGEFYQVLGCAVVIRSLTEKRKDTVLFGRETEEEKRQEREGEEAHAIAERQVGGRKANVWTITICQ